MIYMGILLFFVLEYMRPTSYVPGLMVLRLNSIIPLATFLGSLARSGGATPERMINDRNTKIVAGWLFLVWYVLAGLLSATRHVVRLGSEAGHATVPVSAPSLTIHPSWRRLAPALPGIWRMPR